MNRSQDDDDGAARARAGKPLPVPAALQPARPPAPTGGADGASPATGAPRTAAASPRGGAPTASAAAAAVPDDDDELLTPEFISKLEQLTIVSKRLFAGRMKGERRSPRRGQSVEFADYRNYVLGDDLRFVDWNVYARIERLFLKLFLEEEDLNISIILDSSASMAYGQPDKLLFAKRLAAAVAYIGLANLDRVHLHTAQTTLGPGLTNLRTSRSAHRVFDFLRVLTGTGATNLASACRQFALMSRRGKGVVILISDFLDKRGYDAALKYLLMSGSDVIAIHVLAPDELDPDISGDLRLVDLEDGSTVEVSRSDLLIRQYKKTVELFAQELRDACIRRSITYLYAVTEQPVEELVLKTLRRMGVVA